MTDTPRLIPDRHIGNATVEPIDQARDWHTLDFKPDWREVERQQAARLAAGKMAPREDGGLPANRLNAYLGEG